MVDSHGNKRCPLCQLHKPKADFHNNKRSSDGINWCCRACASKRQSEYRTRPGVREMQTKKKAQYYAANPKKAEALRKYRKEYAKSDKRRASLAAYNRSEQKRKAMAEYARRFPEKRKAMDTVNNAIKKGVLDRARTRSCPCGKPAQIWHHHQGYSPEHRLSVVPLCRECHVKEHRS